MACLFGDGFDLPLVTQDFGSPYRMVDPGIAIKKHPSQYGTHRGIDAALELRAKHSVDPARIAAVHIETPQMGYVSRPAPATGLEGKFSFQYTVCAALLDGAVTMETFTDAAVNRPSVRALLDKTEHTQNPSIPSNFNDMWTTVTVTLDDGTTLQEVCERPPRHLGQPAEPRGTPGQSAGVRQPGYSPPTE